MDPHEAHSKNSQLPILKTLTDAVNIPIQLFKQLVVALFVSGSLLIALYIFDHAGFESFLSITSIISWIMYGVVSTLFAITCHRMILIGDSSTPKFGLMRWTAVEWRFLGWGIFFTACLMAAFASGFIPLFFFMKHTEIISSHRWIVDYAWMPWACVLIPCLYFLARLSLLLPATAVGMRENIEWALKVSKGNGWRLLVIVSAFPVLFSLILWPLVRNEIIPYLFSPLVPVMFVFEICALSLSFKFLTNFRSEEVL